MPTLTVRTPSDRSYSLMKCLRKNLIEEMKIYEKEQEVEVRFVLRKFERTKLGRAILMKRLKNAVC